MENIEELKKLNKNNKGRSSILKRFYNSKEWKRARQLKLLQCKGLCERCKKRGIIKGAYIVHHLIYLNNDNINNYSISLDINNLEALCLPCHNSEHFSFKRFDDLGNLQN